MIKKFNMARITSSDRNVRASVEQIKQQTYVNNIENKTKINELIDGLDSNETSTSELQGRVSTAENTITENTENIVDLEGMMTYSTTESVAGTWIDGKKLYRKVINCGTLPNTTSKIISTGLSTSEVNLVKLEGLAVGTSNGISYLLTLPDISPSNSQYATRLRGNSENGIWRLIIETGTDRTNYSGYVSIYYTKN